MGIIELVLLCLIGASALFVYRFYAHKGIRKKETKYFGYSSVHENPEENEFKLLEKSQTQAVDELKYV
jgi:hypothetical protein